MSGDCLVQLLLSEQGQLKQGTQDYVQSGFEYLQRWTLYSLSGQPISVFNYPYCEKPISFV